jgi:hypothetical protein
MLDNQRVFKAIFTFPDWGNGHFIQWKLDPFFKGARPFNFSLEIAETSDFTTLIGAKPNLGEVFFTIDDTKLRQSWSPNYYYRLKLLTGDNRRYSSDPFMLGIERVDSRRYAMAMEVIRKEILLCRFAGTEAWLLRRKSYGTVTGKNVCNVDPVSGVPIADNAYEDYGVGIDEGYFPPVPCSFFSENTQQDKQIDQSGLGVKETSVGMVRLPGYPLIEVRDIICDARDGTRYSVQARNIKNFPGTPIPVFQKANVNLIPSTDSIYSIALPVPDPF